MRLAVLYDARLHLQAFHALKAWRLAVMALSTSYSTTKFHVAIGGAFLCQTPLLFSANQSRISPRVPGYDVKLHHPPLS